MKLLENILYLFVMRYEKYICVVFNIYMHYLSIICTKNILKKKNLKISYKKYNFNLITCISTFYFFL